MKHKIVKNRAVVYFIDYNNSSNQSHYVVSDWETFFNLLKEHEEHGMNCSLVESLQDVEYDKLELSDLVNNNIEPMTMRWNNN